MDNFGFLRFYPFGMLMPERQFSSDKYRYGFNAKENDNEVKGLGNQQDYGMRVYDQRLGKFLSIDPLFKEYPWYTPYQFAGNTPIQAKDLDGLEPEFVIKKMEQTGLGPNEQKTAWDNRWGAAIIYARGHKEVAENIAKHSGLPGLHNGPADALRHGLFSALNTQAAGEKTAKALGDAHEEDNGLNGQPEQERIMDLYNNAVGRDLAKENPYASPSELAGKLIEKIDKGELLMLDENGKAIPTKIDPIIKNKTKRNLDELYGDGEKPGSKYKNEK